MIENKIITIKKSNTFDKGWTLVTPYQTGFSRNRHFSALNVLDIVHAITKSTRVNLILSETCLSSQIVNELKWANKYIAINLIAKSKEIVARYAQLNFSKVEIDETVDFNYIAIKGKTYLYALIADDCVATDDILNKVYFENTTVSENYGFTENAKSVIFIDKDNDKDYSHLLDACLKAKIPTAYLVGVKAYKQELVHKFLKLNATLLCSDNVRNGILYSTDDERLYCANLTGKGVYTTIEIESATYYVGQPFANWKCEDSVKVNLIPKGSHFCENGSITPLNIKDEKIIERTVHIDGMEDFVLEKFDKSETDKHNQYCTEANNVVYNFTLVPPLFKTVQISDIYKGVETLYKKWQEKSKSINLSEMLRALKDLGLNESGLSLLCEQIVGFDKRLTNIVSKHNYKNYYVDVNSLDESVNYSSIEDYCKELFTKLNAESSETKFDRFDNEIAGYRQIIEEKKALIASGTDVLGNERFIKIFEKKIADVTDKKQRFSGSAAARDNKQSDEFLAFCNQIVNGKFVEEKHETDSIGNVLAAKEISKIEKLNLFVKTYLYEFNQFVIAVKDLLKKFGSADIPTDYIVYEQDGKRVIAIESEQEFYETENIRKHFNLNCAARR
ncbi:MAG: hypothetical protein K2K38_04495 [Clostridia bacterium]|nr:hypothetical protein [Clostridia bacterium]